MRSKLLVLPTIGLIALSFMFGVQTGTGEDFAAIDGFQEVLSCDTAELERENGELRAKVAALQDKIAKSIALEWKYRVVRVVDGDTFYVMHRGEKVGVRVIGIDTPETKDPRKPVQCFGPEASARAEALLSGRDVIIEYVEGENKFDKYGRLLGFVWLLDKNGEKKEMFNVKMIREGYAREYKYGKTYKYREKMLAAESEAKSGEVGLWGECE